MPLGSRATESPAHAVAVPTGLQGSFGALLGRGLLAGLGAGLLAGAVAFVLGEPHIDAAIAIEEAAALAEHSSHAGHSHGEDELVSRTGQRAGLFLAMSLTGLALGAIFATVAHHARRYFAVGATTFVLWLAVLSWLAVVVVPFALYPANPPAVGDPDTVSQRTWMWLASVVLGIAAAVVAVIVSQRLAARWDSLRAAGSATAFVAIAGVGYAALPSFDNVPNDFPATLLWDFRVASFVSTAMLWLSLGLIFALLSDRAARKRPQLL